MHRVIQTDIEREIAHRGFQSNPLRLRLDDHEHVDIRLGTCVAARLRSKDPNLGDVIAQALAKATGECGDGSRVGGRQRRNEARGYLRLHIGILFAQLGSVVLHQSFEHILRNMGAKRGLGLDQPRDIGEVLLSFTRAPFGILRRPDLAL